jgi:serine protease
MTQQRTIGSVLKLCAAAIVALGSVSAHAAPSDTVRHTRFITKTDRLIVKYKDALPVATNSLNTATPPGIDRARQALIDRAGQQFGATMRALRATAGGAHVLQLSRSMTLDEARKLASDLAARDANVEYAEPDRIMVPLATPTDPYYTNQWDLFEATGGINAPAAWDKATGTGINVAVIDTGYRPHADLSGQILQGYDFITDTTIANDGSGRDTDASDPGDNTYAGQCGGGQPVQDEGSSWHGTHVAGTIAARTNNGQGIAGIAYNAKIVPARVLGRCGGYTSDIADAIVWSSGGTVTGVPVNANKARVLNLSLGGSGACDTTTQNAINSARSRGAVVVVAAGNDNVNASTSSPANCAGVITVAATGRTGGKASYSNYGANVDIAAPGGDNGAGILSTLNAGTSAPAADSYAYYGGTSMATPHVAGVAALMLSVNPNLTPDDVEAKLKSSARAFPAACNGCGAGILNAAAAVNAALGTTTTTPTPTPTPTPTAPTLTEKESNNTVSTANPVTVSGTVVTGGASSSIDDDFYSVPVVGGKTLSVTLTPQSNTNFDLYVYTASGALVVSSTQTGTSTDAVSVSNSGTTQTVYVRVRYRSGTTGSTSKYQAKFSW